LASIVRRLNRSNALAEARATAPTPKDVALRRNAHEFAEMWHALQQLAAANEQMAAEQPVVPLAAAGPTNPKKTCDTELVVRTMAVSDDESKPQTPEQLEPHKRRYISPEGRERLRAAAMKNQPWRHSTGPRSARGKAQAAVNGKRRQKGAVSVRERRRLVADAVGMVVSMKALRGAVLENRLRN
jgi:hypothetical protein